MKDAMIMIIFFGINPSELEYQKQLHRTDVVYVEKLKVHGRNSESNRPEVVTSMR